MTDAITSELMAVIGVLHAGDKAAARERFALIWERLDPADHFHRCVLAHYMADAQEDLAEELRWDQRALDAASQATADEFADRLPGVTLASFVPSLHLNLASDHERLGTLDLARHHAALAARAADGLGDSELAGLTRSAIARLATRLGVWNPS